MLKWVVTLGALALAGCYSSSCHIANVRPDTVRPDESLHDKYRLERIVLKKTSFSEMIAGGEGQFDVKQRVLDKKVADRKRELYDKCVGNADAFVEEWKRAVAGDDDDVRQWYISVNISYQYGSTNSGRVKSAYAASSVDEQRKAIDIIVDGVFYAEQWWLDMNRSTFKSRVKEDKKSGPQGTHAADTKLIFDVVQASLLKRYPSVFTTASDGIPLTVVVDWGTEYRPQPNYASILSYLIWPDSVTQETLYQIRVFENAGGRSDDDLWQEYVKSPNYPLPADNGSAIRISDTWETWLLPFGFIPCPGDSDFPTTFCFMRAGKDSLVSSPSDKLSSRKCFRHLVFEPKVDGDVLAAAIMRVLNRRHRIAQAEKMMVKGGAK